MARKIWTEERLQFLSENRHRSDSWIAKKLGLYPGQVTGARENYKLWSGKGKRNTGKKQAIDDFFRRFIEKKRKEWGVW